MSLLEPGESRTIGPEPVGPAPVSAKDAADTAVIADAQPDPEPKVFDEAYVKELRAENAKWRTQLREREAIFDGLEPEEVAQLAEWGRLSKQAEAGDQDALARLNEMLGTDDEPEPTPQPVQFDEAKFRQLAREEAEAIAEEKEKVRQVNEVMGMARGWGFETQRGQKGFDRYQRLCYIAANEIDTSTLGNRHLMEAAKEKLEADEADWKQQVIEEYLANKGARTDTSPLTPTGSGVAPAPAPRQAKSWAEARDMLRERLSAG